ncbi:OLC1v1025978C1 [Oldenlandia corymbosa var. corymbosa]|uniref:OLC1v1025978C1 n=1 Tax=Oldenlandia corymbosa var. corymbosa TaxID=529605 RepID=A0AAV1C8V6_OLDCO|nr:OLC1v1025978C1 [Oldenlandia corymbosa var. corymbosa]
MNLHCRPPSRSWSLFPQESTTICLKFRIHFDGVRQAQSLKLSPIRRRKCIVLNLQEESAKKKGTIAGAISLIIGTSIGSGILALPKKTSPAGLLPSSISMTLCWAFLLVEALLLVEVNVELLKRRNVNIKKDELEVLSIRTMAQETLGEFGGALATITYVFLGYTSMIAYVSKSGEILNHLIDLPKSILGIFFTALFTILIFVGGTRTTDRVNQWLTISMIGLLVAIEVVAIVFGGWSGIGGNDDWGKVPATIPVIIFSLVYHDLAPVLCAYLEGDLRRIRASILVGSFVPLLGLLIWDAVALGLSEQVDQVVDPVELLMRVSWGGMSFMVEAFSLLAVGTSLIGTLLGFSEFFKEQLNKLLTISAQKLKISDSELGLRKWWVSKKTSFIATAMVIAPSLFVSTTVPDAFSAATDIAGGYCMTVLYGVFPPAMAWAMLSKNSGDQNKKAVSKARPTLICAGLLAGVILVEQILQDLSILPS